MPYRYHASFVVRGGGEGVNGANVWEENRGVEGEITGEGVLGF